MPQRCKVCAHPDLAEIEKRLAADASIHALARTFGLTRWALMRHRDDHRAEHSTVVKLGPRIRRRLEKQATPDRATFTRGNGRRKVTVREDEVKEQFLTDFAANGDFIGSAQRAGATRATIQLWLEHDEQFTMRFHQAKAAIVDQLESCALDRAMHGAKLIREVWRGDRLIERVIEWKPQETTLVKLLQALKPEVYGERLQVTQTQIVKTVDEDAWVAV